MVIEKGTYVDIKPLLEVTRACAKHMISRGIYQWNETYPNIDVFTNDVDLGQLYILRKDRLILGSIVVSEIMDEEYYDIEWLTRNDKNIYIHRLAVHPNYQGQGFAQNLMKFAEDFARKNQFNSVRLDTFSQNTRNNIFYQKRGYKRLGDVYFPKQSNHPFHCYELIL